MLIGFDFDNTIVSYDALFHKVALERDLILPHFPINKIAVRDYLRAQNKEDIWTEMQGYVYGARMQEADSFPHVIATMKRMRDKGHDLAIISHKTKNPYLGQQYDLHVSARNWLLHKLNAKPESDVIVPENQIYFELTKAEKIARIQQLKCDVFIDDLPEILLAPQFPERTKRFLFDPENHYQTKSFDGVTIFSSWAAFENYL